MTNLPKAIVPENTREMAASNVRAAASLLRMSRAITGIKFTGATLTKQEVRLLDALILKTEKFGDRLDPDEKFVKRYNV